LENSPFEKNREPGPAAVLAMAGICILFGANSVAIKISLAGFGPFTVAGLRFATAAMAIALWARVTGRPFRLTKAQWRHLLILSAIFLVQLSMFYWGLSLTYASRGILIVNFQPFVVLILVHFFIPGDRITLKRIIGLSLGFAGVMLVLLGNSSLDAGLRTGDAIIFGATLLWGINTVYVKRIISGFRAFQITFYPMVVSAPLFLLAGALWDPVMIGDIDLAVSAAFIYQSLVTAAFGFVVWNYFLKNYGAVTVNSFMFIMPISGVCLGGLILGEPLTGNILGAMLLIGSGIAVVNFRRKKTLPTTVQISRNI
jgi:drug/metabolite transporter (DMT)-like permease